MNAWTRGEKENLGERRLAATINSPPGREGKVIYVRDAKRNVRWIFFFTPVLSIDVVCQIRDRDGDQHTKLH